jgi:DNA repair exonuclease SbcCD ATPase subunit
VRQRHQAIQKIEQDMITLAQLYQDLEAQVIQQEPAVMQIEQRGEEVNDHVAKANTELDGAVVKARAARRKKWWCAGIVCEFGSVQPRPSIEIRSLTIYVQYLSSSFWRLSLALSSDVSRAPPRHQSSIQAIKRISLKSRRIRPHRGLNGSDSHGRLIICSIVYPFMPMIFASTSVQLSASIC